MTVHDSAQLPPDGERPHQAQPLGYLAQLGQVAQLGQFVAWLAPAALSFALFGIVGFVVFGDLASLRAAGILGLSSAGFLLAHLAISNGRPGVGFRLSASTVLVAAPAIAINQPMYAVVGITPIVCVGLAASYVSGRRLVAWMIGAWSSALVTVIAIATGPRETLLPGWWVTTIGALAMLVVVSLFILLIWHASDRQRQAAARAAAATDAQAATERRHQTLVEQLPGIVYVAERGEGGAWHYVSPQIERILGFPAQAWVDDPDLWARQLHPDDRAWIIAAERNDDDPASGSAAWEYRMIARDGRTVWIRDEEVVIARDDSGKPTFVQGVIVDITDRKTLEEELAHRATHDPLTLLANRSVFHDRLAAALRRRDAVGRVAVLYLDVDDFKLINDTLGHAAGDELLVSLARRLELATRAGDLAARAGGDEFTVLIEGLADEADLEQIAERIADEIRRPTTIQGRIMTVTVSIGIALLEDAGVGSEELLAQADAALYEAKARGKARAQRFRAELSERAWRRLELESEIRVALAEEQFLLYFQPIVDLASGETEGIEALVRWCHPSGAIFEPADFIGVAELSGLIVPLGRWILDEALRETRLLANQPAGPGLTVSVNLSPRQFRDPGLVESVADSLRRHRIEPQRLKLEITESIFLLDDAETAETIDGLRRLGVGLVVDDFGTGYSALSYLKRLPVSGLKIDRSFVNGVAHDAQDAAIVSAATAFAQALGLSVTGEGIETAEQHVALRRLGCDLGQGYLFARPMPVDDLVRYLARTRLAGARAIGLAG